MTPISHVRFVALAVDGFDEERAFMGGPWGLVETAASGDVAYFAARASSEPYIVRLRRADRRQVDLIGFAATSREGVWELYHQVKALGAEIVREPGALDSPGGGFGFQLFDGEGRLLEISAEVQQRTAESPEPRSGVPIGLAHAVFHAPEPRTTAAWYEKFLGLRASDWIEDFMGFLRGNTKKHHCMGFIKGPVVLNHLAFEMANADEMMRGLGRMMKHAVKLTWGPGRHTAGDNTFTYFFTPSSNNFEYTAEIEYVPDDWQPRLLARKPEILDQWGTGRITGPAAFPTLQTDPGLWQRDPLAMTETQS